MGKSTFFNRLIGRRLAIVENTPGVTRDRNYAPFTVFNREGIVVDTGGMEPGETEGLLPEMRAQAEAAIGEADVLLFLMSVRDGLLPADREIHDLLRKTRKPVFYVINKVDTPKAEAGLSEFYSLGVDRLYPVSAEHSRGLDDLLDAVCPLLPEVKPPPEEAPPEEEALPPRIAVVGRPNVGKSTLINTLLKKERLVTSPVPGTTRDTIDTLVTYYRRPYCFVDTAGIRRKARVSRGVETYSVLRSLRAIEACDIALLLIDGMEGMTDQDARIAQHIQEAGKGILLLINKWDLVPKDSKTMDRYRDLLSEHYPCLAYSPLLFLSGLTGEKIPRIFGGIDRVMEGYNLRIPTGELNRLFEEVAEHPL
ncbi:MAG: ribosome biogenesis GTPase Der, partial [Nitrospirae bacterium]|nr:ribosome biogenesis GTPase Der [Nitrospirota bacterium]